VNRALDLFDKRAEIAALYITADDLPSACSFVLDVVSPRGLFNIGKFLKRQASSIRVLEHEFADTTRIGPRGRVQDYRHRENSLFVADLPDLCALVGRLNFVQQRGWLKAKLSQTFSFEPYTDFRQTGRRFNPDISGPAYCLNHASDFSSFAIKRGEVLAVNVDYNLRDAATPVMMRRVWPTREPISRPYEDLRC
jgi:hypothetical protein